MTSSIWHLVTLLLVAAVFLEGTMLVAVMRQVGSISLMIRPHMPRDVGGGPEIATIVDRPAGLPSATGAVILFVAPGCTPCADVLATVPRVMQAYPELGVLAAVVGQDEGLRRQYAQEIGAFARVDQELWERWQIEATPFAVAIDRSDRVRLTGVANTIDQLEALAEAALQRPIEDEPDDSVGFEHAIHANGSLPPTSQVAELTVVGAEQRSTDVD